jgi:hypothetical protein
VPSGSDRTTVCIGWSSNVLDPLHRDRRVLKFRNQTAHRRGTVLDLSPSNHIGLAEEISLKQIATEFLAALKIFPDFDFFSQNRFHAARAECFDVALEFIRVDFRQLNRDDVS